MPRRLDVLPGLLRTPCPVDPSTLPRVEGGLACADCGRTVVDVRELTLEELVRLRRRTRSGEERICAAYTLHRGDHVLVRAAHNSSTVIAVAVSVLLAACEAGSAENAAPVSHPSVAAASQRAEARNPTPVAPPMATQAPKVETVIAELAIPSAAPGTQVAKTPAGPACTPGHAPNPKRAGHKGHLPNDPEMLAGY